MPNTFHTMEQKIDYTNRAIEALNSYLMELDLRIVFDYEVKVLVSEDCEIDSMILSLLDNDITTIEHEKINDFQNIYKINDYLIEFIELIEDEVLKKLQDYDKSYYSFIEYDVQMSSYSADFKGVFTSEIEAIIALCKNYYSIPLSYSEGEFSPLSEGFDMKDNFGKIQIRQINLNELN